MKKKKIKKEDVWGVFSKYIRLRYADKNGMVECYTCGTKKHWTQMQAGHGLSGRGNSILFDEEIVRPQCKSCNIFKGGNYDIFHLKLMEEYGTDFLEKKLKQKKKVKKFTQEELFRLYQYYKFQVEVLLKKVEKE